MLDESVPDLDGKHVRVELEVIDEVERTLKPEEQQTAWAAWVDHGPQGPIEDEDDGADWP